MNEKVTGKPLKCWDCAKLGKCQILKPCKDFVKYDYSNKYTIKKVANLCGISERQLYRLLKKDVNRALLIIHKKTGLRLEYVNNSDENSSHCLVKKTSKQNYKLLEKEDIL